MSREQKRIRADFLKLINARCQAFPVNSMELESVPDEQGVYVIYSPRAKKVVHVGRTNRGAAGLRQRLRNHLDGLSSFTDKYLKGQGSKLRSGYTFRCLSVRSPRRRALLEAYSTGCLCPSHLGTHKSKKTLQRK
jgi:hypothetical protein